MNITVLIENLGPETLACEHGLAVHILYKGHSILLDTGSSGVFADNARALGIDLSAVELAVLSHGHYDHADGMRAFFRENETAPMYLRKGAMGAYYSMRAGAPKFVGIHRDICRDYAGRFVEVEGVHALMDGVWLVNDPDPEANPERAQHLYEKLGEERFVEDSFAHEHSLVLEGEQGLVVLNSCSHAGVANIAGHIAHLFPDRPIAAFLGGFHMMGATGTDSINCSREYIQTVAEELLRLNIGRIYTGHCTGMPAFGMLKEYLGYRLHYMKTGDRIHL